MKRIILNLIWIIAVSSVAAGVVYFFSDVLTLSEDGWEYLPIWGVCTGLGLIAYKPMKRWGAAIVDAWPFSSVNWPLSD